MFLMELERRNLDGLQRSTSSFCEYDKLVCMPRTCTDYLGSSSVQCIIRWIFTRVGRPAKLKSQRKTPAASQSSAPNHDSCCICLQKLNPKDETLFCSGSCQKYLHRYCASVSEQAFKKTPTHTTQSRFSAFVASNPKRRSSYKPYRAQ